MIFSNMFVNSVFKPASPQLKNNYPLIKKTHKKAICSKNSKPSASSFSGFEATISFSWQRSRACREMININTSGSVEGKKK